MLNNALQLYGYECRAFLEPTEGIDEYMKNNYDVIITDYKMPNMNGVEVLKLIKQLNGRGYVIIYTAYIHERIYSEAMVNGAFDLFIKPVEWDNLMKKLIHINREINCNRGETE